jgi:hypothetical protein
MSALFHAHWAIALETGASTQNRYAQFGSYFSASAVSQRRSKFDDLAA